MRNVRIPPLRRHLRIFAYHPKDMGGPMHDAAIEMTNLSLPEPPGH